jgi:arylsulfatase A-like enzyme
MVDQLRLTKWFDSINLEQKLPRLTALRDESLRFEGFYTAANACIPARASFLTGLYAHQHWCLVTGGDSPEQNVQVPDLNPGFQTWGKALESLAGYRCYWYGKWHLSDRYEQQRRTCSTANYLHQKYGFYGGTCPSPNGGPGQGLRQDGNFVQAFSDWLASYSVHHNEPFCTTVSLINPHDITWYWSQLPTSEQNPPSAFTKPPKT